MQRVFKYGDIQNTNLTPDKELKVWYIERLPTSSYKGVILKCSVFLAQPVEAEQCHAAVDSQTKRSGSGRECTRTLLPSRRAITIQ